MYQPNLFRKWCRRRHVSVLSVSLALVLECLPLRRTSAEETLRSKLMYYQEDDSRIRVVSPVILYERPLSSTVTLKVDGIYNVISGATPTGAPPVRVELPEPAGFVAVGGIIEDILAGVSPKFFRPEEAPAEPTPETSTRVTTSATSTPTPSRTAPVARTESTSTSSSSESSSRTSPESVTPSPTNTRSRLIIPVVDIDDERFGFNLGLVRKVKSNAVGGQFSYSTERDYESVAGALTAERMLNEGLTTLNLGVAYNHDRVEVFTANTTETKETVDLLLGATRIIGTHTLLRATYTFGYADGFLGDPYRVTELNGVLVAEKRPGHRSKHVAYLELSHFFDALQGSLQPSYRFYDDSFGVSGHTVSLTWAQKLGSDIILQPSVRGYDQSGSDFYAVRFAGTPTHYSSDYRISSFRSYSYGLKLIVRPSDRFSWDVAFERYEQDGQDTETLDAVYPSANVVTLGANVWW